MNPYRENSPPRTARRRIIVELEEELVGEVDAWAVPKGIPSRSQAIRELLATGLEAKQNATP